LTARQLAEELEVSERTILRDIEALSGAGVPVYAVRGAGGGFGLLGAAVDDLPMPAPVPSGSGSGGTRRARLLLSPRGRQLAVVFDRPAGLRVRRRAAVPHDRPDWVEASVRIESIEAGVLDLLSLGADVEVLQPLDLRQAVAAVARGISDLHSE
jgi:predicted DNA-binding transcriptional regulator YafY